MKKRKWLALAALALLGAWFGLRTRAEMPLSHAQQAPNPPRVAARADVSAVHTTAATQLSAALGKRLASARAAEALNGVPDRLEQARYEQELLKRQDVHAMGVLFERFHPPLDVATQEHAKRLVAEYATARRDLLARLYSGYLQTGTDFDPKPALQQLEELSARFTRDADTLEEDVPGITQLAPTLDGTSLPLPGFVPELLAEREDV